jgi:hypothetical protein
MLENQFREHSIKAQKVETLLQLKLKKPKLPPLLPTSFGLTIRRRLSNTFQQ